MSSPSTQQPADGAAPVPGHIAPGRMLPWFLALVGLVTLVRLWVVHETPFQLGPDESQYWAWGRELAWGYFSKPPFVGWIGGLAPLLGGDSAFGARWPIALFHAAGALGIYALTRRLGTQRAAMIAGLLYLMAPGIWLSSFLLSTDGIMIPLAIWGLYAVQRLKERPSFVWAILAGALFGLSALGKYAGLYVPAALVAGALLDPALRRALFSWYGLALAGALLIVLAPNLLWNAASGGATIRHTAANADLAGGARFNLEQPVEWLAEQFGVFGLILFPVGLWACLVALVRPGHPMRGFALTAIGPLLVVLGIAAMSRANANWAAVAIVALAPAAGLALASAMDRRWLGALARGGMTFAIAVQAVLVGVVGGVFLHPPLADRVGMTAAVADLRGWPETVEALVPKARELGVTGIVVDSRGLYHGLHFTGRHLLRTADEPTARAPGDTRLELRAWRGWNGSLNHAESVGGLAEGTGGTWLMASERPGFRRLFAQDFDRIEPVGTVTINLGRRRERSLALYRVSGVRPVTRTRAELGAP